VSKAKYKYIIMKASVIVLDFGSQYTQLLARRVRELKVLSEIHPCTMDPHSLDPEKLGLSSVKAIILSGSPCSVTDENAPEFNPEWLNLGIPVLGVCYGMQLICHVLGAKLFKEESREYGLATLEVVNNEDLFYGFDLSEKTPVWMSHGDHVEAPPEGFKLLAKSPGAPTAAIGNAEKRIYCLQFHPEVVHSPRGTEILSNFIFKIAGCEENWSAADFIEEAVQKVRDTVPEGKNVICGLSGGVDSTTAAVLVDRAIGKRLHCIFVDNGLLRKDEGDQVEKALGKDGLGLQVTRVNAGKKFLDALQGVTEPEKKRKIIGRVFIEVFDEEAKRISNVSHLVQGTLYPDVIESVCVGGPSATIKTHHNVGGLPEKMQLKLIEPFRELFKDEVRTFGKSLQIPQKLLDRQPFPGPGLAVRVIGEVTEQRLKILREADHIFHEEILAEGLYDSIWQSFAVLLPLKSVGVMGDNRTYEETIALRAVYSEDGMTADWCYLPQEVLQRSSGRIINEVKGINRVVLDISSKPPSTIEWE